MTHVEDAARAELGIDALIRSRVQLSSLPFVSVFASSKLVSGTPLYAGAHKFGLRLGKEGIPGTTGGGPGGMEAVNRGLQEGGSISIGLDMPFPGEACAATGNRFLDMRLTHESLKSRKAAFHRAHIKIGLPGGLGTFDEILEELTQCQTGVCHCALKNAGIHAPIILVDPREYGLFGKLVQIIQGFPDESEPNMLSQGLVRAEHTQLYNLVQDDGEINAFDIAANMVSEFWKKNNLPRFHTESRSGTPLAKLELMQLIQSASPNV